MKGDDKLTLKLKSGAETPMSRDGILSVRRPVLLFPGRVPDRLDHAIEILEDLRIPEPENAPSFPLQKACPPPVVVDLLSRAVRGAIDLNGKAGFDAREANNKWADRLLPKELPSFRLPPRPLPRQLLGHSR